MASLRLSVCSSPSIILLLLLLLLIPSFTFAKPASKPPAVARKGDVKYIKCPVCNQIAKQMSLLVSKKREEIAPKQLTEYQIIELAENICNLKKSEGDWILHQDIVEEGNKLVLIEQVEEGECGIECKTIEKTCQEVIGYHDTDLAEYLFKGAVNVDALSKFLCKDLTKVCSIKTPPVPKDRTPGEVFVPKSSKDAEIERIMRSMSDMPGAPGMKVYSKDDLMNGMPNFNGDGDGDGDEDEEEDEEEDERTPNFRKQNNLKDKFGQHEQSFLGAVRTKTQETLKDIQNHITKTTDRILKWWHTRNSNSGKSKPSSTEL